MENKIGLTDGNILIRPCQPEDAAVICEGVQELMQEMLKWAPWCHPAYSISDCKSCRGRNAGFPAPPAQIRTCGTTAYGSYLKYLASKRTQGNGWTRRGRGNQCLWSR